MQEFLSSNKDLLDVVIQLLIVVIPVVLTWYFRTFVRGTAAEKDLAAIVRLSNSAIDYVENLDKRGALDLPPGYKKGGYKLKLAGEWLENELKRSGTKITDEEAQKWIASEFQKRVGGVQMTGPVIQLTRTAVDLVQELEKSQLMELPPDVDRIAYLTGLGADWVIAELAKRGVDIPRDKALIYVRAELLQRVRPLVDKVPGGQQLEALAERAVAFLEELKTSGQLTIQPGSAGGNVDADIVTAWLLTEAAKQGLSVSSDQIAQTVSTVLSQR